MHDALLTQYASSRKRLFLLDYDGTLVELQPLPSQASPTPQLLDVLTALGNDPANTVVVISGRKHQELDAWLGHLPIQLVAEHGLMVKRASGTWIPTIKSDLSWRNEVAAIMKRYTQRIPGALIEEKVSALVWHWRNAVDPEAGDKASQELIAELQPVGQIHKLKIMPGNKIIEIQPLGFSKGTAGTHWLNQAQWDFILVAGDDTTDEDMFKVIPKEAHTIKIGPGESPARWYLDTPKEMLALLDALNSLGSTIGQH